MMKNFELASGAEQAHETVLFATLCELHEVQLGGWASQGEGQATLLRSRLDQSIRFMFRSNDGGRILANFHILAEGPFCKTARGMGRDECLVWTAQESLGRGRKVASSFASTEQAQEFKRVFEAAADANRALLEARAAQEHQDDNKSDTSSLGSFVNVEDFLDRASAASESSWVKEGNSDVGSDEYVDVTSKDDLSDDDVMVAMKMMHKLPAEVEAEEPAAEIQWLTTIVISAEVRMMEVMEQSQDEMPHWEFRVGQVRNALGSPMEVVVKLQNTSGAVLPPGLLLRRCCGHGVPGEQAAALQQHVLPGEVFELSVHAAASQTGLAAWALGAPSCHGHDPVLSSAISVLVL